MTSPSFIRRWSRRKLESTALPPESSPAPISPEALDFSADFSAFMADDVPVEQRTAALRKLFMTDHYRSMDGLDVYVEDYSRPVRLDAMLLDSLAHAGAVLGRDNETEADDAPPPVPGQA